MQRPAEYRPICMLLMVVTISCNLAYVSRGGVFDMAVALSLAITCFIIVMFWVGMELGRKLLILISIFHLFRPAVTILLEPAPIAALAMVVEAAVALPLLVWLVSRRVRRVTQYLDDELGPASR